MKASVARAFVSGYEWRKGFTSRHTPITRTKEPLCLCEYSGVLLHLDTEGQCI